jgi:hypothetical protein
MAADLKDIGLTLSADLDPLKQKLATLMPDWTQTKQDIGEIVGDIRDMVRSLDDLARGKITIDWG